MSDKINQRIASELSVGVGQVAAAVELLGEGATVPFIARYRKEADGRVGRHPVAQAGGAARLPARAGGPAHHRAQEHRGAGQAHPGAGARHRRCRHQGGAGGPVRAPPPKRRTKAQIAREAGLEPLAEALLANRGCLPDAEAAKFIDGEKGVEPMPRRRWTARAIS